MRKRLIAAVATVLLPVAGAFTVPMTADAAAATTLYVNKMSPFCSDTSATAGTSATPFCTIQAGANAAAAGDTVQIFGGAANDVTYDENVTITHSGTATAPITFESVGPPVLTVGNSTGGSVTVNGADYVNLVDFEPGTVDIENSAHVSLTGSRLTDVNVEKGSSSVSFERDVLGTVSVASGVADTLVAVDIFPAGLSSGPALSVAGATGTDIVNNDFDVQGQGGVAAVGISVTGGASGTSIENNVLWGDAGSLPELLVDKSSAAGTTEGYNVLDLAGGSDVPYSWAGNEYSTLSDFQTASGQGTADLLDSDYNVAATTDLLTADDPAVGSANSAALGLPTTDFYGNPWTDDTAVTSTGSGPETYYDRGAVNLAEYTGATVNAAVDEQSVAVTVELSGLLLGSTGSISVNWGDGSSSDAVLPSNSSGTVFTDYGHNFALHQYTSAGTYTVTATIVDASGTKTFTTSVTTGGSTYIPVNPTRVLDTRKGTGDGTVGMISGGHSVAFSVVNGVSGAPAADEITAVVLNVTVTEAEANGYVAAYPDGTPVPKSSNLNYHADENVPNAATVMVGLDGKVDLYTSATTHLLADVEGYYVASTSGGGYNPISPDRLLDTRKGIGAPEQAVGPGKSITLQVAGNGSVPAKGVVAAAMNVTVTGPTANGLITVFPAGGATPGTSNVNYGTGETVANMAIVELGSGGGVEFTNNSKGTVQIIADVAGYYTSTGGDAFIPMAPWRALDTRNGTGQESSVNYPVKPDSNAVWWFGDEFEETGYWSGEGEANAAAVVLNVTVTQPTANGLLVAYPGPSLPIASNINFSGGETIPSMVMVASNASGSPLLYNESKGTTQVIADVFGYFS